MGGSGSELSTLRLLLRGKHQVASSQAGQDPVVAHGRQCHRGHTAALRAVGLAAKLAGADAGFEVGGKRRGGAGKDALLRRLRRMAKLFDHLPVHLELGIKRKQTLQLVKHLSAHRGGENLRTLGSLLRGEQADPDSLYLRTGAPETEKLFEVSRTAGDLAGDGAVNGYEAVTDRFKNSLVGGRFAALVMLRLQPVDGDDQAELGERIPGLGQGRKALVTSCT